MKRLRPRPSRNRTVRSRSLALRAVVVLALAIAGCATPPPPAPEAPAPVFVAPPDAGPVINRDEDFAIVAVRDGDTLAQLAERYLGDAGKAWWIAQFNGVTAVRAGQTIVIPLRMRNAVGVYANGYQTIPDPLLSPLRQPRQQAQRHARGVRSADGRIWRATATPSSR